MRIYKLNEARNKERFFKNHSKLTPEQKEELIKLYSEQYIPDDIIDWNKIESYSYDDLYNIVNTFIKDREEKRNKKNLSRALEGRDYIKVFENKNSEGTEYLYLPLTWNGSKYLASDHFLPKIKVPSKVMNANDFSDSSAKNEDLSPGAKWCISLWTLPDLVIGDEPFKTLEGKELRHEGKRYWLDYTSGGAYFLFYFRDYDNLEDINKKIAFTLSQGSSEIKDITLADDNEGDWDFNIERIQEYWDEHYPEYKSQIEHIQEVSKGDYPKFIEYEEQKEQEARGYLKSHIMGYLTYNESTGRYDSNISLDKTNLKYLIKNNEFSVSLGVINGNFDCGDFGLKTLKNGPIEVTGDFICYRNLLTTLEGAPKKVGGDFECWGNYLKTLEYAPQEVGGEFNCWGTNLITLEGAPKKVGGAFYCYSNKLTTLKGSPKEVGGNFSCSYNNLTTLKGAPEFVGRNFDCYGNKLTTLEYAPEKVGGDFHCWDNPLQSKDLSTNVKGRVYYDYNSL